MNTMEQVHSKIMKPELYSEELERNHNQIPFSEYETISKQQFQSNEFREKYAKHFIVNGFVVSSNSAIMQTLAAKMNKNVKAVYLMVKRQFINEQKSVKIELIDKDKRDDDVEELGPSNENIAQLVPANENIAQGLESVVVESVNIGESFSAKYDLKESIIFEIMGRQRQHRGKQIQVASVQNGWATKLALFLYENTKLCCKFDFRNIWVLKDGLIKVEGSCECNSNLKVTCHHSILSVDITNISTSFQHSRKYQMRGILKEKLSEQLKHNSALAVQTQFVNEMIPDNEAMNEEFNPFIRGLNTNRIIKHRGHARNADPIDVISEWTETKYKNVISAVSRFPFYVFFRTALQLAFYMSASKRGSLSISTDATGSVVMPPPRSQKIEGTEKLKHVFLYVGMLKTAGKSVPFTQMLSQDQSSDQITFWLKKSFKNLKPPREVVCDESKALLKSLVETFAGYRKLENYVAACMSSLINGTSPPDCYIRIDRSHFVKNVTKKIRDRDQRRQKFYRGVVGYLIGCDTFSTAKKIIHDFFTVILNMNDGEDEHNQLLPSELARKRLLALCNTHDKSPDYTDDFDVLDAEEIDEDMDYNADCNWIEEILKNVPIHDSKDYHDSLYYNAGDKNMYVKLFSSIALWSNVMNTIFDSSASEATSSDVESFFKSLKHGILQQKMFRADEFLELYIDFANAEIKCSALPNHNEPKRIKKSKRSKSLEGKSADTPGKYYPK